MPNGAYAQRERTRLRHSSQERSALHVYSRDLMCVACLMLLDSRDRFAQIAHALAHIDAQACLQTMKRTSARRSHTSLLTALLFLRLMAPSDATVHKAHGSSDPPHIIACLSLT